MKESTPRHEGDAVMALSRLLPRLQPRPETVPDEPADDVPAVVGTSRRFSSVRFQRLLPSPHPAPKAR